MVLSQVIAKRRLAADVLPGFWRAWLLVFADVAIVLTLLALVTEPLILFIYATQPSEAATGFFLVVLYLVVPAGVLINACVWAYRSRKRY